MGNYCCSDQQTQGELQLNRASIFASGSAAADSTINGRFSVANEYKCAHESSFTVNRDYIIQLLNDLDWSAPAHWDLKQDKDRLFLYINNKGSKYNNTIPVIKTIMTFPNIQLDQAIKALTEFDQRTQWDTSLEEYRQVDQPAPDLDLVYTKRKKIMLINSRDFIEKRIQFQHEESYIIFHSSCSNSFHPLAKDVVRALDYFTIQILSLNKKGDLVIKSYFQHDAKYGNGMKSLLGTVLGQAQTNWYQNFAKHFGLKAHPQIKKRNSGSPGSPGKNQQRRTLKKRPSMNQSSSQVVGGWK